MFGFGSDVGCGGVAVVDGCGGVDVDGFGWVMLMVFGCIVDDCVGANRVRPFTSANFVKFIRPITGANFVKFGRTQFAPTRKFYCKFWLA